MGVHGCSLAGSSTVRHSDHYCSVCDISTTSAQHMQVMSPLSRKHSYPELQNLLMY